MSSAIAALTRVQGELPTVVAALEAASSNLAAKIDGVGHPHPARDRHAQCERDIAQLGERFVPALERGRTEGTIAAKELIDLDQLLVRAIAVLRELCVSYVLVANRSAYDIARLTSLLEVELQPAVYKLHQGSAVGQEVVLVK